MIILQQQDMKRYIPNRTITFTLYEPPENTGKSAPAAMENLYYFHPNHLGTGTLITNSAGEPHQYFVNLPYGETLFEKSQNFDYDNPYKFNGKELDQETGLYYYGARYYDPETSVWLSVDPLVEKYPNLNPYTYTFSNPVRFMDPTGMEGEDWIYDKIKKEYVWDGNVRSADDIKDKKRYEYVGPSILDVKKDFNDRHPLKKWLIVYKPKMGENITYWPGEIINEQNTLAEDIRDGATDFGMPEFIANALFDSLDGTLIFIQNFYTQNPTSLDGSILTKGSSEHLIISIQGMATIASRFSFRAQVRGFNMAQSNKLFKGTWYNKLPAKIKGKFLKIFNWNYKRMNYISYYYTQIKNLHRKLSN